MRVTLRDFKRMPAGKQQAYADLAWGWLQLNELKTAGLFETNIVANEAGLRDVLRVARQAGVYPRLTALRDTLVTKLTVPENDLEAILLVAANAISPERRRELLGEPA